MLLQAAAAAALTFHAPLDDELAARVEFARSEAGLQVRNRDRSFAAPRNVDAAQGTISFRWSPGTLPVRTEGHTVFAVEPAQPAHPGDVCLRVYFTRGLLRFQIRDRNLRDYFGEAGGVRPAPDRSMHVALTWSEVSGAALYLDGVRRAAVSGPMYLRPQLGRFRFLAGEVRELRIYSGPLDRTGVEQLSRREEPSSMPLVNPPLPAAGRHGWHAAANIPQGSRFHVKKIAIEDARAVNRFWWKLVDGRRDTVWPVAPPAWRYRDEQRDYQISPVAEPFNVVRTTGDAAASLNLGDGLLGFRPANQELHYYNFRNPLLIDDVTVDVQSGTLGEVACLRVEPLGEAPPAGVLRLPAAQEVAVRGVRIELDTRRGDYYYFSVVDPESDSRKIVEFDLRATTARVAVELEFAAYPVPAGHTLRVETSSPAREVTWLGADLAASRAAHLERRRLERRDLEQYGGPRAPAAWTEPPAPDGVPRWAWQQVKLVARYKQVVDWWIDFRQIETGEFGNGPEADVALAWHLPAVARLDGKVARYRQSVRKLFEFLAREQDWGEAREAARIAHVLDPGSPIFAEMAMEAERTGSPAQPTLQAAGNIEQAQSESWRRLEENFEWLTTGEPQRLRFDASALETIRLGQGRAVSWENTGGEIAAVVDEATPERLRVRVFAASRAQRRIGMRVWGLAAGEYELAVNETRRRVALKPMSLVELDLPAREVATVKLTLLERGRPVAEMPDLAIDAKEIWSDARGLAIPVHNLGAAPASRFEVTVTATDGTAIASAFYAGLEAPVDKRARILLARFGEIQAAPGLRVSVRLLDEAGAEPIDTNNDAVLPDNAAAITPGASRVPGE